MKKITRNYAIQLFDSLASLPLGHLDGATLSVVLDNFEELRKVKESYESLSQELSKRLYDGMDEDFKRDFFEVVSLYEREQDVEKKAQHLAVMKNAYGVFYEKYTKHVEVLEKIFYKEVEVDLNDVDKDAFIKGILLGRKELNIYNLESFFLPLFKEKEEETTTDMSELDEYLK
jgi:hypothetical protein